MRGVLCWLMKINYVYWEVGFDGIVNVVRNSLEVEKFNVGCCMERFFEDNDFSWSENEDGFKWNEDGGSCFVVEGVDGSMRWVYWKD